DLFVLIHFRYRAALVFLAFRETAGPSTRNSKVAKACVSPQYVGPNEIIIRKSYVQEPCRWGLLSAEPIAEPIALKPSDGGEPNPENPRRNRMTVALCMGTIGTTPQNPHPPFDP